MENTLVFYNKKFFWKNKKIVLLAAGALTIIISKNFLKNLQQFFLNKIVYSKEKSKNYKDLYEVIAISMLYFSMTPAAELMGCIMENNLITHSFSYFYSRFLEYKYIDWKSIINSEIYTVLHRRAKAISGMHKNLFIDALDALFYVLFAIWRVLAYDKIQEYYKIALTLMIAFPVIMNLLTLLRTKTLRKSNEADDLIEELLKDIFMNYEMIHTHNMIDYEIERYKNSVGVWRFWFVVYWMLESLIGVIYKIVRIIMIMIVFNYASVSGIPSTEIVDKMKAFSSALKRLDMFTGSVKTVLECRENAINSRLEKLRTKPKMFAIKKDTFTTDLSVVNLTKYYMQNLIFEDLNLKIKKGEKIAITGPNGSGKSTFIKLLLGLEKYEGEVLIDGMDLKHISEDSVGRLMAYVPQENIVFEGTLYDNITAFDNKIPEADVLYKLEAYGLHETFKAIGYDTVIREGGKNLSSAQRQRISLARAVVRDSPIMIFDEATSEMDKEQEKKLIELVLSKSSDKTVIMIIHNLALLNRFDKVLFFNNKATSELISYDEMIEKDEDFRKYCIFYK